MLSANSVRIKGGKDRHHLKAKGARRPPQIRRTASNIHRESFKAECHSRKGEQNCLTIPPPAQDLGWGEVMGEYPQPLSWVAHTSFYKKLSPIGRAKSISSSGIASSSTKIRRRSILFEAEGAVPRWTSG